MDTRSQRALAAIIKQGAQSVKDFPSEQWTPGLTNSRLHLLESYWNDFQANHVSLLQEVTEGCINDPYFKGVYYQVETDYVITKGLLYDVQTRLQPGNSHLTQPPPVPISTSSHSRLPRITVPPFNGDRQEWESFKDLFQSLIHTDQSLKDVDKLYYLKTLVSGEALLAIQSIPITADNYSTAWSILEARYDNKYLLVQSHLLSLRRVRQIKEESPTELQGLIDNLQRHRDQLRALGRPVDHWDDWFVSIATDVMDPVTRRDWEEELQRLTPNASTSAEIYPSFTQLSTFLQRRCQTLKSLDLGHRRSSATSSRTNSDAPARRATTAVTSMGKCASCEGPHYVGHCDKFHKMAQIERRELVRRKKLCFNLKDNHFSSACPSAQTCRVCRQTHHSLLHAGSEKRPADQTPSEITPRKQMRPAATDFRRTPESNQS